MNNSSLLVAGMAGGILINHYGPKLLTKVKQKLSSLSKPKQDANVSLLIDTMSGVNSSLSTIKEELNYLKGQVQTVDQQVKQVKTDNNLTISGIGSADARLNAIEKATAQCAESVQTLAILISKLVDMMQGSKIGQGRTAAMREQNEQFE